MRQVYNDSDDGNPVIKRTLEGFTHVFGQPVPIVHTPLTVEQVLAVSSVPDDGKFQSVRDLARDTFIISFMAMGMQAWDMYGCEYDDEGYIVYERSQVRNIRADRGFTRIKPHPLLLPYLEKYGDKRSRRKQHRKVFSFHRRYSNALSMTSAITHKNMLKYTPNIVKESAMTVSWRCSTGELTNTGLQTATYRSRSMTSRTRTAVL